MYDIPIKQKKSTKLTLKEEENRLELIKKENVDKIHDIFNIISERFSRIY